MANPDAGKSARVWLPRARSSRCAGIMADDSQPDPEAEREPWEADDPAETVRLAIGFVAMELSEYGLGMPGQLSAVQAGDVLASAGKLLGMIAEDLHGRAADDEAMAEVDGPELLSPAIRQAFEKGCAPASPDGLERAILEYRLAHLALPSIGAPLRQWNDPAMGTAPSPAKVRDDISRVIRTGQAFRETLECLSGSARAIIGRAPFEAKGITGYVRAVFDQLGELIGYAEIALDELGDNAKPGRTVSPKTRLALWLGDFLATSGVPVVVGGKPSEQWALAYDLALEANGDGICPHARKTLQNAIALRRKERMPPAA